MEGIPWYNNTDFNEDKTTDYIFKLQLKFPYVGAINPRAIDYSNSGAELKKDYTLEELENEIDNLLRKADDYFEDNPNIRDVTHHLTHLILFNFRPILR